ncbi:MAG: 3-dehydroquinate synthase [Ignavibacteriaceae bacterium]|nr:3-dehydroquinate synthase [Ignavibacteriaceae bacterium]
MKKIKVNTASNSYPVLIGNDIFESLREFIKKHSLPKRAFILLDKNVERIYGSSIRKVINTFAVKKYFLAIAASERIKSFKTVDQIFTKLYEEKFSRDTLLIAIGGGTIGDVAGFVASTYMRGVPLIHIPTTLLSDVDSSIGGKTGINFKEAKNLIGTFYQPSMVLIDTNFLKSLPAEELVSGFGEVIKYSYLTNGKLYSTLLSDYDSLIKKNLNFLSEIIYESVKIKSAVLSRDEHEISGLRKMLNLGHTFAHAFESNSNYGFSHGKAVITGIVSSLFLSFELRLISEKQLNYMLELPLKFKSSIHLKNFNENEIFRLMNYDKKNKEGKIKFVLIKDFGEILVDVSVPDNKVKLALKRMKKILV